MVTETEVLTDECDYEASARVIEAAMSLVAAGRLTAGDAIEMGCMAPGCLTVSTLMRVARATGTSPLDLLG